MNCTRKRPAVSIGARALGRLLLVGLFMWIAFVLRHAEIKAAQVVEDRFRLRVETAAPFLQSYIRDLLRRERLVAEQTLSEDVVEQAGFDRVVSAFGFEAAVLVDAHGKLTAVFPARAEILGASIVERYSHLRRALVEGSAVSSVVVSASASSHIVAFAVRYGAQTGTRVFSGAYDVTQTPLHAYMSELLPIQGASADLIDDRGVIVATNRESSSQRADIATIDPTLTAALKENNTGICHSDIHGERLFVSEAIKDTPWRLVAAANLQALYAPLAASGRWILWLMYASFCVAVFSVSELLLRLADSSEKLSAMNDDLARLARVDRLTGVSNRLHLEEQLARLTSAARRRKQAVSVMVIDVDHFKSVNDSYGHAAGDEVLRALAMRMASALRAEDLLGRWGGEEFLALLPNTDAAGAHVVAERLRTAASAEPIVMSDGMSLCVTVSVGCATSLGPTDNSLIDRADKAVYSAKTLGRNRVVSSDPPPLALVQPSQNATVGSA